MVAVKRLTSPAVLVTIVLLAASILPLASGLAQRELNAAIAVSCVDASASGTIFRVAA